MCCPACSHDRLTEGHGESGSEPILHEAGVVLRDACNGWRVLIVAACRRLCGTMRPAAGMLVISNNCRSRKRCRQASSAPVLDIKLVPVGRSVVCGDNMFAAQSTLRRSRHISTHSSQPGTTRALTCNTVAVVCARWSSQRRRASLRAAAAAAVARRRRPCVRGGA